MIPRWGGNKKKKEDERFIQFSGAARIVGWQDVLVVGQEERGRSSPPMFTKGTVEERLNRNPVYR